MQDVKIFAQPNSFKYNIFLDDDISEPFNYREEFDLLENAAEGDVIIINVNSHGGRLDTTVQFIALMQTCRATIVTRLVGSAYSGASMIFLAGHEQEVSNLAELMAHGASTGSGGKVSDLAAYAKHTEKHTGFIMEYVYEGFLTPEELIDLHNGKEFWMDADEISERLVKRQEARDMEITKQQEAQMEAIDAAYADMFGDEETPPTDVLLKLTKQQLVAYIEGEINVSVGDDGKVVITDIADKSEVG